jgi:hypothetical protein
MKRKLLQRWRLLAIGLALLLGSDATGAFAAVVLVVPRDACCHAAQSAPACPIASCMLAGCLPRAVEATEAMPDLRFSCPRERWMSADEFGNARAEKPPVPPPRR